MERPATTRQALDSQTLALLQGIEIIAAGWRDRLLAGGVGASRAFATTIFEAFAGPPPEEGLCAIDEITVPGGDGDRPARLYRPFSGSSAPQPVVVFLHGGGWALGSLTDYDVLVHSLAVESGVVFLALDYRLAPEHSFPAAQDDVAAVLAWLGGAAAELGLASNRIALMGDSAGGCLAAAASWLGRGRSPAIVAQWLIYPMTDVSRPHGDFASRLSYGDGDMFLARGAIDAAREWYIGDRADLAMDPRVSPLLARDLAGMPPSHFVIANCDPLRDEARAYYERLRDAGAEASWRSYETAIHAFLSFGVLDMAKAARTALARDVRDRLAGSDSQRAASS